MTKSLAAKQAAFEKASAELRDALNQLQRFPAEFALGTVLTFTKTYVDRAAVERTYIYAAIRTEVGWFTTAQRDGRFSGRLTWSELVEAIGDSPCAVAEGFRTIPVTPDALAELRADGAQDAVSVTAAPKRSQVTALVTKARKSRTSTPDLVDRLMALINEGK